MQFKLLHKGVLPTINYTSYMLVELSFGHSAGIIDRWGAIFVHWPPGIDYWRLQYWFRDLTKVKYE
jgi:hypothetical protein